MTLDEFKSTATARVNAKLVTQKSHNKLWNRARYIDYIHGLIEGYSLIEGVSLTKRAKQGILADIMIDSGVLADILD